MSDGILEPEILPPAEERELLDPSAFERFQARSEAALAQTTAPEALFVLAAHFDGVRRLCRRMKAQLSKQNAVALLRLKTLRKLGTALSAMEKNRGGKPPTSGKDLHRAGYVPTLADLGFSYRDSAKWQRLAAIPDGLFKERVRKICATPGRALSEASFATLPAARLEDGPKLWTLSLALQKLDTSLHGIIARWPAGAEAREALAAALRAYAREVEGEAPEGVGRRASSV